MNALLWLIGLLLALPSARTCQATPIVEIQLEVVPKTHDFMCRYTWWIPPTDTTTSIAFNLNRQYHLARLQTPGADQQRVLPRYYPYFADTLQRVEIHYPKARIGKARQITLTYSGTLTKPYYTEQVHVFSAHSGWLPMRLYHEYDAVDYKILRSAGCSGQEKSKHYRGVVGSCGRSSRFLYPLLATSRTEPIKPTRLFRIIKTQPSC